MNRKFKTSMINIVKDIKSKYQKQNQREILDMKIISEIKNATNTINRMEWMNEWISWKIRMNILPGKSRKKKRDGKYKEKLKSMEKCCVSTNILTAVLEGDKNKNLRKWSNWKHNRDKFPRT